MRARRHSLLVLLLGAPFVIAPGCLLPSFERLPAEDSPSDAGQGGGPGAGGMGSGDTGPGGQGTGGTAGSIAGGEGGGGGHPGQFTVRKQYVLEQGTNLSVSKGDGLLVYTGADDRDWTNVTRSTRDASLPSSIATLGIRGDGSFTFEPAASLFGSYHATYALENDLGEQAAGDLTVTVQPVAVDLGDVESGVGGFAVNGLSGEGVGSAVSGVGDVDADGFDDFLVGAPTAAGGGAVYLVFGAREHASFDLERPPGAGARYSVLEGSGSEALGTSLSGAGDLDGDGFGDFIVGAPGLTGNARGQAYVVYGRARAELSGSLADVVAAKGRTLTGGGVGENAGMLVAGGADITGDATPDLVVFSAQIGRFFVVDGSGTTDVSLAVGSVPSFAASGSPPALDTTTFRALAPLGVVGGTESLFVGTGSVVALMKGPAASFPASLSASDFTQPDNGLRIARNPPTGADGLVSVASAADLDGDGDRDAAFCDDRASTRCRIFLGMPAAASDGVAVTGFQSPEVRVAGGGETSGDGFADLLFAEEARAWVLFGRAALGATLNVTTLGARGFPISGGTAIGAVALAGDVDGADPDGAHQGDWLLGDAGAAGGDGRVYVLFGGHFSR